MNFSEFSELVNFDIYYSGFLVGSKVNCLKIYKKRINNIFYISLACSTQRTTVCGVTLYLNKYETANRLFLFEKFINPDFLYFSKDEIYNISLIERSSQITRDVRSDLHLNDIKSLQAKNFQQWLGESIDDLLKKADSYDKIISLNDTSTLKSYDFNRVLLLELCLRMSYQKILFENYRQ